MEKKDRIIKALKNQISSYKKRINPVVYNTKYMGSFKAYQIGDFELVRSSGTIRYDFDGNKIIYKNDIETFLSSAEFKAFENIIEKRNKEIHEINKRSLLELVN